MQIKSQKIECDNVSITVPSITIDFVNGIYGGQWIVNYDGNFAYRANSISDALRYLCGKQLISTETRNKIEKRIDDGDS